MKIRIIFLGGLLAVAAGFLGSCRKLDTGFTNYGNYTDTGTVLKSAGSINLP